MSRNLVNKIFIIISLVYLSIFCSTSSAQINTLMFGASIGFGEIKSNTPQQSTLNLKILTEFETSFWAGVYFRLSYQMAKDFEAFLPDTAPQSHFPYFQIIGFSGHIKQYLNDSIFLKEGAGIIAVNDRLFKTRDIWGVGTTFNLMIGLDLRENLGEGFTLGAGVDYGLAFNVENSQFYTFSAQLDYYLF